MLTWLNAYLVDPVIGSLIWLLVFVLTNLTSILGFLLAVLIIRRVFSERQNPGNFYAWFLLIIFVPLLGVPLYFLLGGRKSRKLVKNKLDVTRKAIDLAKISQVPAEEHLSPPHPNRFSNQELISSGNRFELLPDGVACYERFCREIDQAEHTIHIATYILSNDATGQAIVERLMKRAEEGITIRLLLDSLGSWNCTRAARYRIRRAGGEVAMFMPVLPIQTNTSSNLRNHRKIAIFDNSRAITGGQNLDNRFMGEQADSERFTDFSIFTEGPAVAMLTRTFIADWAFANKESPTLHEALLRTEPDPVGESQTSLIVSGPDVCEDPLWEQIVRLIQEFEENLTIITPYFVPDEVIFRSLIVKARTGRQIRLIIPLKSNQRLPDVARHDYFRRLNAAGVDIQLYTPRMMHGKLILVDGKLAMTGSANIDMRSLFVNFEIAQLHHTPSDVEALSRWADTLLEDSIPYREALTRDGFLPHKSIERLVHLIKPLL